MSRARQGAAGEGARGGGASAGRMESSLACGAAPRLGERDVQAGAADAERYRAWETPFPLAF